MITTMLEAMEQQTAVAFKEKGSAQALWLNEWAQLVLRAYEPGRKVAYVSAYAFPMEILAAFDVVPFDFELTSGLMGATNLALTPMEEAERRGYSLDVCAFHRTALGAFYLEELPQPQLLITTSYYCDGKAKTNEILGMLHGKETLLLQVPAAVTKESVRYVARQLRDIARRLGEAIGQDLDEERLKAAVRSSNKARQSQRAMLELLQHRPAPWGGAQLISFSINSLLFTGSAVKEKLNDAFALEMQRRIEGRRLRPEKHRIYWFAWIPTYPCNVFDILRDNAVSIPLCETFRIYWDEIDEGDPFEGLALKCLHNPFVGPGTRRTQGLEKIMDDYHLEGAILFATPACRQANAAYALLRDAVAGCGRPFLMLDMDISDPRNYSAGQTATRLEAFVELLEQRGN
ncbi:MAG: 2-hydroxyacyl-CoA dehydratase family protein [Candidatus Binataceae bacterium]